MVVKREETVDRLVRLMGNGNVKVITERLRTPGERVYVQSAYAMETDAKREQETLPLRETGDSFRKIVVTGDYQDPWRDESGVVHVGVIPFLLDKKLIER